MHTGAVAQGFDRAAPRGSALLDKKDFGDFEEIAIIY